MALLQAPAMGATGEPLGQARMGPAPNGAPPGEGPPAWAPATAAGPPLAGEAMEVKPASPPALPTPPEGLALPAAAGAPRGAAAPAPSTPQPQAGEPLPGSGGPAPEVGGEAPPPAAPPAAPEGLRPGESAALAAAAARIPTHQGGEAPPRAAGSAGEPASGPAPISPPGSPEPALAEPAAPARLAEVAPEGERAATPGPAPEPASRPTERAEAPPRAPERGTEQGADVLRQVRIALDPRRRSALVRLDPPELGAVSIRLEVREGRVRAVIRADAAQTLELLERHLPELRATLARQGLEADEMDLGLAGEGDPHDGFDRDQRGEPARRGERRGPPSRISPDPVGAPHGRPPLAGPGLDTYA